MQKESRMKRWDKWLKAKFDTATARVPALGLKIKVRYALAIFSVIVAFAAVLTALDQAMR